jgi:hypothetical protein
MHLPQCAFTRPNPRNARAPFWSHLPNRSTEILQIFTQPSKLSLEGTTARRNVLPRSSAFECGQCLSHHHFVQDLPRILRPPAPCCDRIFLVLWASLCIVSCTKCTSTELFYFIFLPTQNSIHRRRISRVSLTTFGGIYSFVLYY